jgi:hypothetical protein
MKRRKTGKISKKTGKEITHLLVGSSAKLDIKLTGTGLTLFTLTDSILVRSFATVAVIKIRSSKISRYVSGLALMPRSSRQRHQRCAELTKRGTESFSRIESK